MKLKISIVMLALTGQAILAMNSDPQLWDLSHNDKFTCEGNTYVKRAGVQVCAPCPDGKDLELRLKEPIDKYGITHTYHYHCDYPAGLVGTYFDSCNQCRVENNFLKCHCRKQDGSWNENAQIDLSTCPSKKFYQFEGDLKCGNN